MKFVKYILAKYLKSDLQSPDRSHIIKGIVQSFIIQLSSALLVFLGNFIAVKLAGAGSYGVYVHIFNWVSILTILAIWGQDDVALSHIPKYKAAGKSILIATMIRRSNVRIAVTGCLVTLIFLTLLHVFSIPTLSEYKTEFLLASVAVWLSAFLSLNQMILQSLNHIRLSQVTERLLKPLLFILFIFIAWTLNKVNSTYLIILAVINLLICAIVAAWLVTGKTKPYFKQGTGTNDGSSISKQSTYFLLISLLQLLVSKIGMLLLPNFTQTQDVGIYNICLRFADLIIYPSFLMHSVLPQLFARHHTSDAKHRQALFSESILVTMVTSIPIATFNIIFGKFILGYFGQEFTMGYTALIYLCLSNFLFVIFVPCNTILMMQGKEKYAAFSLFVTVLVLTVMTRLFIPYMGMEGAALAMFFSYIIYGTLLSFFAWRHTGVIAPFFKFLVKD